MATGVYAIRNAVNGKVYVGSTSDSFTKRWSNHLYFLERGRHASKHLQASWNRYGAESFEWVILEECSPDDCIAREQHWIDELHANDRTSGYNARLVASSNRGLSPSEEARAKQSAKLRGRKHSPERVAKMSAALKGRGYGPEVRARMSAGQMGKKHSEATKLKMSATRKGRKYGETHCIAISRGLRKADAEPRGQSGFRGVQKTFYASGRVKYRAIISVQGTRLDLGYFDAPEEAARAYRAAENQYFPDQKQKW